MRRPSPLPPPPAAQTAPPARTRVVEADREHVEPGVDEATIAAPSQATPVVSAPSPEARPVADADSIGLRDVWRAARARRKALRAEIRRFTAHRRRRRAMWLVAGASVVLLVLLAIGAAYSPLFGVERITVVGASQLDAAAVEDALDAQLGTPLALVDESAIKAALVEFPLVETYSLEARPPHELVVRIVERTPIGVVSSSAGYTLVDAAGVALATTSAAPANQPILTVRGGVGSPGFAAIGRVMRALPESIRLQVTAAAASTSDDVTLTLGGSNAQIVWGSAEDSAMKAETLEKMMISHPPATVTAYDVSSEGVVSVR